MQLNPTKKNTHTHKALKNQLGVPWSNKHSDGHFLLNSQLNKDGGFDLPLSAAFKQG